MNYTWSKKGKTPIVKTSGVIKGYKVFGLIEYFTGKFFYQTQEESLHSDAYIHFLKRVLEKTNKHLHLIQDGSSYHTSKKTKEFFKDHSNRITVYQLPSYSPDYNPIAMLWKKIKVKGVHMHYFPTFDSLKNKVLSMLDVFQKECQEILSLFGFYEKLKQIN